MICTGAWDIIFRMFLRVAGKAAAALAACAFLTVFPSAPQGNGSPDSDSFTLENGLKVFLLERRGLPLVHTVVGVGAGSRNETAGTSGLTHVLEHLILFRGSRTRTPEQIGRDTRENGGHFNAHTGQDLSLFELTVPAGREGFALRNLADIVFDHRVDPEGLDAERAVILEEMSFVEDDPVRSALALVYLNLFPGHPYARPITGTREGILTLTVDRIASFYRAHFFPSNASLAVVGDFDLASLKQEVQEVFGPLRGPESPPPPPPPAPPPGKDAEFTLKMDVSQAYCLLGFAGPDYHHPDQFAVDLLTEVLGRGVNPMLGSALRGERRLIESASMAYHAHDLGGAIIVFLTLDPRQARAAAREALSFLRSSRRLNFSPDDVFGPEKDQAFDYLRSARNQIRFLGEKSREKGLNTALSLARHLLLSRAEAGSAYLERIEKTSSTSLRQAAAKYFGSGRAVTVTVLPLGEKGRQ